MPRSPCIPRSGRHGELQDFSIPDISYPCPGTEYIPQMAWTGTLDINTNPSLWGRLTFAE